MIEIISRIITREVERIFFALPFGVMHRQNKNLVNRFLFSQMTMAVLGLLILVAIGFPLAKNIGKQYKINQEIKGLEKEIDDLESKNSKLTKLIEFLESDQFVQEQARLNLNYKKEGEEVVVVQDESVRASTSDEADKPDAARIVFSDAEAVKKEKNINNPERWWRYFLK